MEVSYQALLAQRKELDQRIEQARQAQMGTALSEVRSLVSEFDLRVDDVFPSGRQKRNAAGTNKVPAKFRNPETGQTWTGRGKPPAWIAGKDRTTFEIPASA